MMSKGQEELVRITIKENYHIYPIHIKDIYNMKNILFNMSLRKTIFSKERIEVNKVQDLFYNFNRDPLIELNLNLTSEIPSDTIKRNSLKFIEKNLNNYNLVDYHYLESNQINRTIKFYDYETFHILKQGNYFGELGLENKSQTRTATIQALPDCYLGYINTDDYRSFISRENQNLITKNSDFLSENFFFKSISSIKFREKYLNDFICEEYKKGDYLFRQNTDFDYIYFICEGEVHLTINNTNFIQINTLIKTLCDNLNIPNIPFGIIIFNLDFGKTSELELSRKRVVELFYIGEKQIVGIDQQIYGGKRFYSAKVHSNFCKVFKISSKVLI